MAAILDTDRGLGARLEIDLGALQRNYLFLQSLAGPEVAHGAVLKSDAYGLGAGPIAAALQEVGCTVFFVGDLTAALDLRAAQPQATIIAFEGYRARDAEAFERSGLVAVANAPGDIATLRAHPGALSYVLNLDTGLNRRGLSARQAVRLYLEGSFRDHPPWGVMSHLACAAQPDHPLNDLQETRFAQIRRLFPAAWASLAASTGLRLGTRFHHQLTRLGSALFGLNDARDPGLTLNQVIRLSAPIHEIREVAAGGTLGYGATSRGRHPRRIAVIGLGYAQGFPWAGGNRHQIRIGSAAVPVVGRLSMESLLLDVTGLAEDLCHAGGSVALLDQHNTLDALADAIGGIAQEILLHLGQGCRREFRASAYRMPGPAPVRPLPERSGRRGGR